LESTKKRFLASFSVFNIIVVAMCAGLGIAVKPVIVPLVHIITGPLFIPGGAVAGGFYMLFIVIAVGLVQKRGVATLTCAVQAVLVLITGVLGSHGIMSLITYVLPGVLVDLLLLLMRRHNGCCAFCCFLAGMAANLAGTFLSNMVFFRLPFVPLMLTLLAALLSGGLGGLVAWGVIKKLRALIPAFAKKENKDCEANEK
jgi:hypothetical protein